MDPNDQLGPFVEGLLIGAIDWPRLEGVLRGVGWSVELTDVGGRGGVVFMAPSGRRWQIVAEKFPSADRRAV